MIGRAASLRINVQADANRIHGRNTTYDIQNRCREFQNCGCVLGGFMLRTILSLTISVLFITALASASDILTLEQAVALALENNRGLRTSALEAQKAEDRLKATRTRQFPGISVYMLAAQQL